MRPEDWPRQNAPTPGRSSSASRSSTDGPSAEYPASTYICSTATAVASSNTVSTVPGEYPWRTRDSSSCNTSGPAVPITIRRYIGSRPCSTITGRPVISTTTSPSCSVSPTAAAPVTIAASPASMPTLPASCTVVGSLYDTWPARTSSELSSRRSTGTVINDASGARRAAARSAGDWIRVPMYVPSNPVTTAAPTTRSAVRRRPRPSPPTTTGGVGLSGRPNRGPTDPPDSTDAPTSIASRVPVRVSVGTGSARTAAPPRSSSDDVGSCVGSPEPVASLRRSKSFMTHSPSRPGARVRAPNAQLGAWYPTPRSHERRVALSAAADTDPRRTGSWRIVSATPNATCPWRPTLTYCRTHAMQLPARSRTLICLIEARCMSAICDEWLLLVHNTGQSRTDVSTPPN